MTVKQHAELFDDVTLAIHDHRAEIGDGVFGCRLSIDDQIVVLHYPYLSLKTGAL